MTLRVGQSNSANASPSRPLLFPSFSLFFASIVSPPTSLSIPFQEEALTARGINELIGVCHCNLAGFAYSSPRQFSRTFLACLIRLRLCAKLVPGVFYLSLSLSFFIPFPLVRFLFFSYRNANSRASCTRLPPRKD